MMLPVHDLRLALRTLAASPLFTTVAVLSLSLGIGANTAIFTLVEQVILRRLPVKNPDELVMLYQEGPHPGNNMGTRMHSYPLYQALQQRAEPLAEVVARRLVPTSVSIDNQTERLDAELVSGNYFTMLGVGAAAGRVFSSAEDDRGYLGHPSVVLSHDYWMRRFAGDPAVVGRSMLVNSYPMTIVGVAAAGFAGLDPLRPPQIRVPILMMPVLLPEWTWIRMDDERSRWVQVFARLRAGETVASAQGPLQGLFLQIRQHEMTLPGAGDWSPYLREQFMKGRLRLERAGIGYSPLRNDFSTPLLVLMGMVGLVLLIACANVANLLIARASAREREIAVRLSLGATRGQLVRQLLVESLLLAGVGGTLGLLVAIGLTRALVSFIPADGWSLLIDTTPDWRVLGFTGVLSLMTGLVFGLVPAWHASRPDTWATLKATAGAVAGGHFYLRRGLVTAQVALGFVLLFGAGLFVRSLDNLRSIETGVALDNLVTFRVAPALSGYAPERAMLFYQQLLDRLRGGAGVTAAAMANVPILSGDEWDSTMSVEGHEAKDGEDMQAFMNELSPGYFEAMGIRLLEGRDFTPLDSRREPAVAIVNRRFAEHFFPGQSALGRHLGWGSGPDTRLTIEIVGVVENSLYEGPREGVRRQVFVPFWGHDSATFYLRSATSSSGAYALIRNEVSALDAAMPVYAMKTLQAQLDERLLTDRLLAMLAAGFGLLATLLACVGLYGVMAFAVARRGREMAVRLALGAKPAVVIRLVMQDALVMLGIGLAVGIPAALALGRFAASQLHGVEPQDTGVALSTTALLGAVAALAGFVPARRASRIDPVATLRCE